MYNPHPNARFWILGPDTEPVKITLRPGQSLEYCHGGPTEEGWSREEERWTYERADAIDGTPARILRESYTDGADCDGRHSSDHTSYTTLDELKTNTALADTFPGVPFPTWSPLDSSQRDYAAEAAGY